MKLLMRLLREPLFHFIAIGGLIFALYAAVNDTDEAPVNVIVIAPERIDQLATEFSAVWKRMPTDDELDFLIEEEVRAEVYYREAPAMRRSASSAENPHIPNPPRPPALPTAAASAGVVMCPIGACKIGHLRFSRSVNRFRDHIVLAS
jgi:hypothetical protein